MNMKILYPLIMLLIGIPILGSQSDSENSYYSGAPESPRTEHEPRCCRGVIKYIVHNNPMPILLGLAGVATGAYGLFESDPLATGIGIGTTASAISTFGYMRLQRWLSFEYSRFVFDIGMSQDERSVHQNSRTRSRIDVDEE